MQNSFMVDWHGTSFSSQHCFLDVHCREADYKVDNCTDLFMCESSTLFCFVLSARRLVRSKRGLLGESVKYGSTCQWQ